MPTYPLPTVAPTITAAGITAPPLVDIIKSFVASVKAIYGDDLYLDEDAEDYELLALYAQAQNDSNQAAIATALSFSPQSARGVMLSNLVKINNIQRQASSNSTTIERLTGVAGTILMNCQVADEDGNIWNLPPLVIIPAAGTIDVTATAAEPGAITAPSGTLTVKFTPVVGWQTATNTSDAVPGAPVEKDGALRERQAISTAIPSRTSLKALRGAIANLPGVTRSLVYQNDGNAPDGNGIPAHSIAAVVAGGDAAAIAAVIELEKDTGCGTAGTTTVIVEDPEGLPIAIRFYELTETPVYVIANIVALDGFVSTTSDAIKAALVAFINALAIGEDVYQAWLVAEAGLANSGLQQTFVINTLYLGTAPGPGGTATIAIAFNAAALTDTSKITVNVT